MDTSKKVVIALFIGFGGLAYLGRDGEPMSKTTAPTIANEPIIPSGLEEDIVVGEAAYEVMRTGALYRATPFEPLGGKYADDAIVGRIIAMAKSEAPCSNFLPDWAAIDAHLARQSDTTRGISLRAQNDAKKRGFDEDACRLLAVDAGNWMLSITPELSESEFEELKMIASLSNNDCYWERDDFFTEEDSDRWYALAERRYWELTSARDAESSMAAIDAGQTYGTSDLEAHCPIIQAFGEGL